MNMESTSIIRKVLLGMVAAGITGGSGALAQDFPPGEPQRDPRCDTVTYEIFTGPPSGVQPPVQFLDLWKDEAGAYLVFAGEEHKDYMVWLSHDMQFWSYSTMAGCIGPGLYSAHVEACAGQQRAFFLVMEVENGQIVNPQQLVNGLLGTVLFLNEIDPQDPVRQQFEQVAGEMAAALAEQAAKENALADKRRQLAACTAEVERLRLEALAAWREATIAESNVADAEEMVGLLGNALVDANRDLAGKQANLAEWQAWGAAEIAEAEAAIAAGVSQAEQYRLENHIAFINTATERREGFVAEAEAAVEQAQSDLADAQAALGDAIADAEASADAAQAAQEAYELAREACGGKEGEVEEAQQEAAGAAQAVKEAAERFTEAAQQANEHADQVIAEREQREAEQQAQIAQAELERRAQAEADARQKLEDQLAQWKMFLDGIRASHGQDGVDLLMTQLKAEWDQGIAALQLLSGMMEGLARGGTVQAALAGAAMSGIQVGYGALVAYAQSAAVNGVTKLASGRAAEMLKGMSDLEPGESRYHGMKNEKGEVKDHYMVTKNADGTHTVWAFNDGKGVLSSDSVHQHILKK
jgi:chemotaxis protein histidine kinase CheA